MFFLALVAALVALSSSRSPRRRGNPELERKVEDGKRLLRELKARDLERTLPHGDTPSSAESYADEVIRRAEAGEPVDFLDGLSPEAQKYLPPDQVSTPEREGQP